MSISQDDVDAAVVVGVEAGAGMRATAAAIPDTSLEIVRKVGVDLDFFFPRR